MRQPIGIGLLGFGGVNQALVKLLDQHNRSDHPYTFRIVGVSDLHFGSAINPSGLSFEALQSVCLTSGALSVLGTQAPNNEEILALDACDIVSEATYSDMNTGQPAITLCREALSAGKHVVTTNKGVVAFGGAELAALARARRLRFEFEGAVMSGTPALFWARNAFPGASIQKIRGVLNGTTNFILSQMELGEPLSLALREAQRLGYAEADPTSDLEGFDVRAKAIVLSFALFSHSLKKIDIPCTGITELSDRDFAKADAQGKRWKLLAEISCEGETPSASVGPVMLDASDPLYWINGTMNALEVTTECLGPTLMCGPGAGRTETAYALYADILRVLAERQ